MPFDQVLQEQLEYFATMIAKSTAAKQVFVIASTDHVTQTALKMNPDNYKNPSEAYVAATMTAVLMAAGMLAHVNKQSGGKRGRLLVEEDGELVDPLERMRENVIVEGRPI